MASRCCMGFLSQSRHTTSTTAHTVWHHGAAWGSCHSPGTPRPPLHTQYGITVLHGVLVTVQAHHVHHCTRSMASRCCMGFLSQSRHTTSTTAHAVWHHGAAW